MMQCDSVQVKQKSSRDGWLVLLAFVAFFLTFASVDTFFVLKALKTHTGVVSQNAYEEGLAYNEILHQARAQDDIQSKFSYDDKSLSLYLSDSDQKAIDNAAIRVTLIRTVQDGHDFDVEMTSQGQGHYKANVDFPYKGVWNAKVEALWQAQGTSKRRQYRVTIPLMIK